MLVPSIVAREVPVRFRDTGLPGWYSGRTSPCQGESGGPIPPLGVMGLV